MKRSLSLYFAQMQFLEMQVYNYAATSFDYAYAFIK